MSAKPTASTLPPTTIEKSTSVVAMRLDAAPTPEENSARLAPKTMTWNDMMVLRRFREYDIAKIPRKMRTAAVVMKMI